MVKNFSDKYLNSLKLKAKMYQVREAKGFAVRILPSGCKTFMFIYEVDKKRKYLNLGIYPHVSLAEARIRYNNAVEALYRGEPLAEVTQTVTPTVAPDATLVKDLMMRSQELI